MLLLSDVTDCQGRRELRVTVQPNSSRLDIIMADIYAHTLALEGKSNMYKLNHIVHHEAPRGGVLLTPTSHLQSH